MEKNFKRNIELIFTARPRIASGKNVLWQERRHSAQKFAGVMARAGAHVCLDGPSGVGKTSLALTYLFTEQIPHVSLQITTNMDWFQFCRQIITPVSNQESSIFGDVELGLNHGLPTAKFRLSLGEKGRPIDDIEYMQKLASSYAEHDVARRLCDLNAVLYIDDVERANDILIARLSDLCKLLTQTYVSDRAKVVFVGSEDIYQRLYKKNPSLEERLIQVSLGAFKSPDYSWKLLTSGFEKLNLLHPGTSKFVDQKEKVGECINAIWEAADGLPKSLNRLGYDIAMRAASRQATGISAYDILEEANQMTQDHWVQFGRQFQHILPYIGKSFAAALIVKAFYERGIARIQMYQQLFGKVQVAAKKDNIHVTSQEFEGALHGLVGMDFIVRTGKNGEILFVKHPTAAHALGVAMRNPARFKDFVEETPQSLLPQEEYPIEDEYDLKDDDD